MSVSRGIVLAHEGHTGLISEGEGEGSDFFFSLPMYISAEEEKEEAEGGGHGRTNSNSLECSDAEMDALVQQEAVEKEEKMKVFSGLRVLVVIEIVGCMLYLLKGPLFWPTHAYVIL